MTKKKYPPVRSLVEITFLDGEVRSYEITAGSGLSKYLCEQASETGILCFIDARQRSSLSIPVANIREWTIKEIAIDRDDEVEITPQPEPEIDLDRLCN